MTRPCTAHMSEPVEGGLVTYMGNPSYIRLVCPDCGRDRGIRSPKTTKPLSPKKAYRKAVRAELRNLDVWEYVGSAYSRKWLNKHIAACRREGATPNIAASIVAHLADAY